MINVGSLERGSILENKLEKEIDDAARLHGHLGPFLVIGVRMGRFAVRILKHGENEDVKFQVTIKVPQTTPFTCTIDGIQSATHCTIGNKKLEIEKSDKEILGVFEVDNSRQKLRIHVKPEIIEDLMAQFRKGIGSEKVAAQVAVMQEEKLFTVERI
jgi:formylmethanofuran dehydrogenase subunit E